MWATRDTDRRFFFALMFLLVALAWLVLWAWGQSSYERFLSHHSLEAVRETAALTLVFVGCCWSLMLLMFAVGVGNLGWMLLLWAVMAAEKNVSWGRHISAPLGVALLGWGLALGLRMLPVLP